MSKIRCRCDEYMLQLFETLTRINYRNQVVSKFPKLIELYKKLFNEVPNNLHNSLNDVLVCFRCYFKMRYNLDILMEDEGFIRFKCF